jgi:periplasmic protein TonB
MRLLVGVATAALFHGVLLGMGLVLLPRQAVPASAAPVAVDVEVVPARPVPVDVPWASAPGLTPAPARSPSRRPTRPHVRGAALAVAASTPPGPGVVAVAVGHAPGGAVAPGPAGVPATVTSAQPRYRSNPAPPYPIISHRRHEEGTVLLKVAVGADGIPTAVMLERSCGHRLLDDAALDTVRRWTFEPARAAGVPIASVVIIPVRFAQSEADR